ncbi:DNA-3-methyladenine glycosylase I [Simiduia curdlanivorans]|uniref:DNA-3-methyladenine glycosylase I n=1 Tax=Simiduia curdlanivorans TaxID=1492769 RepID=A0ABV8V377_9GAMM|nr:DNA-3-methyladenine glycosylase I [Simiduia curdlanivorans]MDN3640156.1 DNA-3-methyladenine glycosylase I [Simiduia curdlanivorans]
MRSFKEISAIAELHKGGRRAVAALMPEVSSPAVLAGLSDDRYLSELARRVFRAGLKHAMVDAKWPAFEQAFWGFVPEKVQLMSDEQLERLASNPAIIRHLGKIRSVRANAAMVVQTAKLHGSFGRFIADWPGEDIIGLWAWLKKQGNQMGGHSGARFLRMVGKDTFILTDDVVAALKHDGIVNKMPTAKKDLARVQEAFNHWQRESGLPLAFISKTLSLTVFD